MHLSLPKPFPVYFSFFCLLVSSVSNFHPDTRGGGGHFFRHTCLVMLWGGRNTANKYHWRVWGMLAVFQLHWVCPCSHHVCFHGLHCSGSRLLCQELSEAGPGLCALSRSKPLRFRFLGTPQRCRLSWACVLCPSQVRAALVTRCLASTVSSRWGGVSYRLPHHSRLVFWVYNGRAFSGVTCVSSGELISGCDPPGRCQQSRIPSSLG